jgi:hypothetical protein
MSVGSEQLLDEMSGAEDFLLTATERCVLPVCDEAADVDAEDIPADPIVAMATAAAITTIRLNRPMKTPPL